MDESHIQDSLPRMLYIFSSCATMEERRREMEIEAVCTQCGGRELFSNVEGEKIDQFDEINVAMVAH